MTSEIHPAAKVIEEILSLWEPGAGVIPMLRAQAIARSLIQAGHLQGEVVGNFACAAPKQPAKDKPKTIDSLSVSIDLDTGQAARALLGIEEKAVEVLKLLRRIHLATMEKPDAAAQG
jgi:hypothetical protein